MVTGTVFDIEKFAVHDGSGIRTVVFLKGCPLRCSWCHNPESQEPGREILFREEKCVNCGACVEICPRHCHFIGDKHTFERSDCIRCGLCAKKCYTGALENAGDEMSVEQVMESVLKDKPFYDNSGGGLTLSGGEPMMQFPFTFELLKSAKAAGLNSCIETCGYALWDKFESILPYVDSFLYDIKILDSAKHKLLTGVPNGMILDNLKQLDSRGCKLYLRCPLIPGINDDDAHLVGIARLAESLRHVEEIDLEPYHPLGIGKCRQLGRKPAFELETFVPKETAVRWQMRVQSETSVRVRV